jgi:hypothetical protein
MQLTFQIPIIQKIIPKFLHVPLGDLPRTTVWKALPYETTFSSETLKHCTSLQVTDINAQMNDLNFPQPTNLWHVFHFNNLIS